ncbi:MAG: hypothetical protein IT289_13490 [Oligoflexia bacterium]|nr:hypothetical protein [Oligoflexia bacterium]
MKTLLELISSEHQMLLSKFNGLMMRCTNIEGWTALIEFCEREFEDNHHRKEELFVFSTIKDLPQLRAGGPHCTYFFEFQMKNPSLTRALAVVKAVTGQTLEPQWTDDVLDFRNRNLPLVIPCEDHEAGRILLRSARHISKSDNDFSQKMEKLFAVYKDIQMDHFEREESCLIPLCQNLVSQVEWGKIMEKMRLSFPDLTIAN